MGRTEVALVVAGCVSLVALVSDGFAQSSLNTHGLGSPPHDVAITPDGTKAVVRAGGSGDGTTVYDLIKREQIAVFDSGDLPSGADAV